MFIGDFSIRNPQSAIRNPQSPMPPHYDLAVIGAGSGGIGAALTAARFGLSVLLIERADMLGGTAVRGGVHVWEPGAGGTGFPFDIYRRLKRIPDAVGVYSMGRHMAWRSDFPGGEQVIDPARRYRDSLRRHGPSSMASDEALCREYWHGVVFEPEPYVRVVEGMLAETGYCTVLRNTAFAHVRADAGRITSLRLDDGREVEADAYVDATADGLLCRACGCPTLKGRESRATFDEPDAPERATEHVNAVSLIYRVTRTRPPDIESLPSGIPAACWWREAFPVTSAAQYPCGDYNMNMLPTMEGDEFLRLEYRAAYAEARRRVLAHWRHNQTIFPEFQHHRLSWIAPALGVRESYRIVGEYVLTQHDLLAGLSGQRHPDIITIADHPMDVHGRGGRCRHLPHPYGVPYRCLIPRGFVNLLVACRAASFSAIAASSCRLSRTMMQLGQAAGTAAALAKRLSVALPEVPSDELRQALRAQHVQLDWPLSDELLRCL